jgi:lipopolysaccharide export system permease protein
MCYFAAMRLMLYRHFIIEWLSFSVVSLILLMTGLLGFQAARFAPLLFRAGLDAVQLLWVAILLMPSVLTLALPLALALGLLATFARWQRDGEWLALMACGVSRQRLAAPVMFVCLIAAALYLGMTHFWAPRSLAEASETVRKTSAQSVLNWLKPGHLMPLGNDGLLYVRDIAPDGSWVGPFWVIEDDNSREVLWAWRGMLSGANEQMRLTLLDGGWHHMKDGVENQSRFSKMEISLAALFREELAAEPLAPDWQQADASGLRALYLTCPNTERCARIESEFSRRSTGAIAMILFGVFGLLSLGGRLLSRPPAAYSLAAGLLLSFYLLERLGVTLGEKGVWPSFYGPWLPVAAFTAALLAWRIGRRF